MQSQVVLEVQDLSVLLGGNTIVDRVSFCIKRGEITAIVGPNGSGKTTLVKALLGLLAHCGRISWAQGTSLGYVPQRFAVPSGMPITVEEFFLLKSRRFWLPGKDFMDHLPHELELVGLAQSLLKRPLGALSGGEIQRLLVSWAMLEHPEVLLFDEPAAAVDIGFSENVHGIMKRLTQERGTTIILISHDLNVVWTYASTVLCLNRRLLCQGPPKDVLTPQELGRLFGEVSVFHHDH